ncbi:alpha/beta hydrolase family protein [Chitinophaga silvisoli]|uniref:Alpha/beta fold hydrolase n=1 Tax=Chitinophaga silvisoli TaxID=2291814 RepID=A0A3E1P025_9BACT|nr:alpha/beta fold hydrolase [Chitinophaga silvisoli]RFM33464.1 alpha/beta fold hydrolase [Chitinophaga silvisoli]
MKKTLITTFLSLLVASTGIAQQISGDWNGLLKTGGPIQLHITLKIEKTDTGYQVNLASPDQGAANIPVSEFVYNAPAVSFKSKVIAASYTGEFASDSITGTFTQGGHALPLTFHRGTVEGPKRPQEPKLPLPYYTEEVSFENAAAKIQLAGTLTMPQKEGSYPAVILITGSGAQNRDEELLGHKPFLIISDYLTRQGIAVLRYDDRGFAKSGGTFKTATSLDFASDVESAIAYLKTRKEIKQIGLIGHSEGGLIAPIVAAKNKDVAFIVMLAGTGIRGDKLLLLQTELISRVEGTPDSSIAKVNALNKGAFDIIVNNEDDTIIKKDLGAYFNKYAVDHPAEVPAGTTTAQFVAAQVKEVMNPWPWLKFLIKYDPVTSLKKVHCPVLALNGEKDLQVPPKENLGSIRNALKGNKHVTIKEYPGLNHLFQECKTGSPSEYAGIEQTISPVVLEDMSKWIKTTIK